MRTGKSTQEVMAFVLLVLVGSPVAADELTWPPKLAGQQQVVRDTSPDFLQAPETIQSDVQIARTPPAIDFAYYPGQDYPGNPWSVWGDGCVSGGKYYSAIGDHKAPDGNAFVYEYDPARKALRLLSDVRSLLNRPSDHYTPGKIHTMVQMGTDGWLYFATHRGSTRITTDEYHYQGDWLLRHHPETGQSEIVAQAPAGERCIPTGLLDPQRLIFYGGTAEADHKDDRIMFFAYDVKNKKQLHASYDGPYRYLIHSSSTGRVYYTPSDDQPLRRFDPEVGQPEQLEVRLGLRSATQETPQGYVYTVSRDGELWRFDVKTEEATHLGSAVVGTQTYITSIDADPTGRYLYYMPGAHGGSSRDGTPVVQYDTKTGTKKVIAFLHPFYHQKYGYVPIGTFGSALSDDGSTLFITWNGNRSGADERGRFGFDTCALTVVHIPESERQP